MYNNRKYQFLLSSVYCMRKNKLEGVVRPSRELIYKHTIENDKAESSLCVELIFQCDNQHHYAELTLTRRCCLFTLFIYSNRQNHLKIKFWISRIWILKMDFRKIEYLVLYLRTKSFLLYAWKKSSCALTIVLFTLISNKQL